MIHIIGDTDNDVVTISGSIMNYEIRGVATAVNYNAKILKDALNRIAKLEKRQALALSHQKVRGKKGVMNCEDCVYSDIADWEQDEKTGKAKAVYWCKRHEKLCEDIQDCQFEDNIVEVNE